MIEQFIRETLLLWIEENNLPGTVVVEKRPPTELTLPKTANKNG